MRNSSLRFRVVPVVPFIDEVRSDDPMSVNPSVEGRSNGVIRC